jgi:hypothetical protein
MRRPEKCGSSFLTNYLKNLSMFFNHTGGHCDEQIDPMHSLRELPKFTFPWLQNGWFS